MRPTALFALPALLLAPFAHADDTVTTSPLPPSALGAPAGDTSSDSDTTATAASAGAAPVETATPGPVSTAGAAAAPSTPSLARRGATAGPQLEGPRDGLPDCRASAALCAKNDRFALWPRLRLRNGFEFVQPDSQLLTVGQNDGFFLDQNRVGIDGAFRDDIRFRLIVDVVSTLPGAGQNDPVQPIVAAVRDAWVAWMPSDWFYVSAGQQFMPADLEGSTTIASLPFARRSVATAGVRPGHGLAVGGLSPTRQLGIVIGSTERSRFGNFLVEYVLAGSNGNGQNLTGNDNKLPAAYGRAGVGYAADEVDVRVGVGGRFNPRTVGTLPNLFSETDALGFADLSARVFGVVFVAQGIYRQTSFDTVLPSGGPGDTSLGATAWLQLDAPFGVDLWGMKPAYRFSFYDVSSVFPDDQLLEHTLGLRWDLPFSEIPLTLFVDGTLLSETGDGVRDLDNARLTTLVQFDF
jgi:hypothetical protein